MYNLNIFIVFVLYSPTRSENGMMSWCLLSEHIHHTILYSESSPPMTSQVSRCQLNWVEVRSGKESVSASTPCFFYFSHTDGTRMIYDIWLNLVHIVCIYTYIYVHSCMYIYIYVYSCMRDIADASEVCHSGQC